MCQQYTAILIQLFSKIYSQNTGNMVALAKFGCYCILKYAKVAFGITATSVPDPNLDSSSVRVSSHTIEAGEDRFSFFVLELFSALPIESNLLISEKAMVHK